jgi:hypothetical protein
MSSWEDNVNECPQVHIGSAGVRDAEAVFRHQEPPIRRPWKCPICEGAGMVTQYAPVMSSVSPVPCHACGGTGIVWG